MTFRRLYFSDSTTDRVEPPPSKDGSLGDSLSGENYVFNDRIRLAVNAALATRRPLLVEGPPGSGKSTLAPAVARQLGWTFHSHVVTSRTTAQDLLWEFDSLRRLHDAQTLRTKAKMPSDDTYIRPGILWRVFDPKSAKKYLPETKGRSSESPCAVALLDEIDKADPDVPNDLLVPLGSEKFHVKELRKDVKSTRSFLLVVTSNGERDLAPAFVRRCIRLRLEPHSAKEMAEIAALRFKDKVTVEAAMPLAEKVAKLQEIARIGNQRLPSTAEFLDTVAAALHLGIQLAEVPGREDLLRIAVLKVDEPR